MADANKRRPEAIFEAIYRDLYATYRTVLSSDSRSRKTPKWMKRLQIIDSTTITLFSNLLFKQMKQNFPLKYFYGESANAIKIQIWVTLIANLLLMVMQKGLTRQWSFSGLATMVRITPMYYVDFYSLFNNPEKDWEILLGKASDALALRLRGLANQKIRLGRRKTSSRAGNHCSRQLLSDSNKR